MRPTGRCASCRGELSREGLLGGLCAACLVGFAVRGGADTGPTVGDHFPTDGFAAPPCAFTSGQIVGHRFCVRCCLGVGGVCEVWLAADVKRGVNVALKAPRPGMGTEALAVAALRREARLTSEVASPNIRRVYGLVHSDGMDMMAMEYIEGTTLLEVLEESAPLPLAEAWGVAVQFLSGLEALHAAGLVHLDLKPENIMVTPGGRVVLVDLGTATGSPGHGSRAVAGTPAYMAPEVSRGDVAGPRADVFAAGVVLAEMISSSRPAGPTGRAAIWREIRREPPVLPDSSWAPVIRRAVSRRPEERFRRAAALARALHEATSGVVPEGADASHGTGAVR